MASIASKSFLVWSMICTEPITSPPAVTLTPSKSCSRSVSALACSCAPLSPPVMPATISPVLPSLLINACAACGGAVHADVTWVTNGKLVNWATISAPAAPAAWLCTPPSEVTAMIIRMSPWANFSHRSRDARHDSDVGSWKPPEVRLLATGHRRSRRRP
jgi:hypothetical protein